MTVRTRVVGGINGALAGLALLAAPLATPSATEAQQAFSPQSVTYAVFEGRDYLLIWPPGVPAGVVVYLHTIEPQPLVYEAREGMLEALAVDARNQGFALLAPSAEVRLCDAGDAAGAPAALACWRTDAPAGELAYIDRLVASIERQRGVSFGLRDIVGFGRGSDLASAAWMRGQLGSYRKIGLLTPRMPASLPDAPQNVTQGPLVYVEAPAGDPVASRHAGEFLSRLVIAGYGRAICARSVPSDARYRGPYIDSFVTWFARDCRIPQPPPAPPAQQGGGSPPIAGRAEADQGDGDNNRSGIFGRGRP